MLMQEAFRRALDQLELEHEQPHLEARTLNLVHSVARGCAAGTALETDGAKLVYSARRLARRWCSYVRPVRPSPRELDGLRDEWVVFVRQLVALPAQQQHALLWELVNAMEPEQVKHDVERGRYLISQVTAHPELFVGLTACPNVPWPGPASFFIHTIEELEDAPANERTALHRSLSEHTEETPSWLVGALAEWVDARYETESATA